MSVPGPASELVFPYYPDEAFANAPVEQWPHFCTMVGCVVEIAQWQRREWFRENALTLEGLPDDPHVEWSYTLAKPGAPIMGIDGIWVRHMPIKVSFRATNHGSELLRLHLRIDEMGWEPVSKSTARLCSFPRMVDVPPGQSILCVYETSTLVDLYTGKPVTPVMPLFHMVLTVDGASVGVPVRLALRDLRLHYPVANGLTIRTWDSLGKADAGDVWRFSVVGDGLWPDDLSLEWRKGPWVGWRLKLDSDQIATLKTGMALELRMPTWLTAGKYRVVLCSGGYFVPGPELHVELRNRHRPGFARNEIKPHLGRLWPMHKGQPVHWQGWASYDYQPGPVREFGATGHKLFVVPVSTGQHLHHQVAAAANPLPDIYDYGQMHERVGYSLQAHPESVVMLRVSLTPPPWWVQQHEQDRVQAYKEGVMLPWEETSTPVVSLASKAWLEYQTGALKRLIKECEDAPWADRLLGVFLSAETTEEWFMWGSNDDALADYSEPFQAAWREWTHQQGRTDLPPTIAPPEMRRAGKADIQADSADGRWCAATSQFLSDITSQVLNTFCTLAKKFSSRRLLTAAWHGYVVQLAGEPRQNISGHFGVRAVLDNPDIDILSGITLFAGRSYLYGSISSGIAEGSVALAGKMHLMENDLFSWLHPGLWHQLWNDKDPRLGAIDMHQRLTATAATEGYLEHKFSLMTSWHHDSALMAEFGRLADVTKQALLLDRSRECEVAILVDDRSMSVTTMDSKWLMRAYNFMITQIAITGAPAETYLLSDAHRLPARIKYVVVAGGTGATERSLEGLRQLMEKRKELHVLAIGPIGLVQAETGKWLRSRPAELFGLPITISRRRELPGSMVTAEYELKFDGFLSPRAEVAAKGEWSYIDGVSASATRSLPGGGQLTWVGSAPYHAPWLRGQLMTAGVHLYAPLNCTVRASKQLLAVTASADGMVQINLRQPAAISDLYSDWRGRGQVIDVPFRAAQTRLFKLER